MRVCAHAYFQDGGVYISIGDKPCALLEFESLDSQLVCVTPPYDGDGEVTLPLKYAQHCSVARECLC